MKNPFNTIVICRNLLVQVLFVAAAWSGHAAIVLTVDITDPSAVVFTATDAGAGLRVSGGSAYTGLNLEDFFRLSVTSPIGTTTPEAGSSLTIDVGRNQTIASDVRIYTGPNFTFDDHNINLYWLNGGNTC